MRPKHYPLITPWWLDEGISPAFSKLMDEMWTQLRSTFQVMVYGMLSSVYCATLCVHNKASFCTIDICGAAWSIRVYICCICVKHMRFVVVYPMVS